MKKFFDKFNYLDFISIAIWITFTVVIGIHAELPITTVLIITAILIPFMFLFELMMKSSFKFTFYNAIVDELYKYKKVYKIQSITLNNKLYYMAILSGQTKMREKFEYVILNGEGRKCLSTLYPDNPDKIKKNLLLEGYTRTSNRYLSDTEEEARQRIKNCKAFVQKQKEEAENPVVNTLTEEKEIKVD